MANLDDDDLPALPDVPDGNDFLPASGGSLDDDAALRKIRRRTSNFGAVAGTTLIVGAGVLGYVWFQRSQAYDHRWDAWQAAQEAPSRDEFLRIIREDYPHAQFNDVRERIMLKLGEYRDAASVPLLRGELAQAGVIRAHAARSLAMIGSPAADAAKPDLLAVLPTTDARDRTPVVWALAVLNEPAAADAILEEFSAGRLQHQHGFDPLIIVRVLGIQRLASLTSHANAGVRMLVAQALSENATTEVIAPLETLLRDEDPQVCRQAAAGLGRIGDARAAGPLFTAMQQNPGMRVQVLDALRRSTGARGLGVLLSSATDDDTRRDLVTMLRATHDPAAADPLATQIASTDDRTKLEAASGLAELGDARAVPVLVEIARGDHLDRARDALEKLLLVQAGDTASALIPMLSEDRFMARRAGILRVLGRSGSQDAGRELVRHLDGDDAATAALALAELNYEPAFSTLLRMIPRPRNVSFAEHMGMAGVALEEEYAHRTAAVRAIGRYGRPEAAEALMTIIEDAEDDLRLRSDAGLALGAVADDATLAAILDKVTGTTVEETARRYYIGALWQHPSRAMSSRLLDVVANTALATDVRLPIAVAVGYAADPANDARLIQLLDNPQTDDGAAFAIVLGGGEDTASALLRKLGGDNDFRMTMQDALMNASNDWFNMITTELWESGEVHRRMRVAQILNEGVEDNRQGFAWNSLIARLQSGWGGVHGLSTNEIRRRIYADLTGPDAARRTLAVAILEGMSEMGLLLAARDAGGPGSDEARAALMRINRPAGQDDAGGAAPSGE